MNKAVHEGIGNLVRKAVLVASAGASMRTASKRVSGAAAANALILKLAGASQWFQYEPLPYDEYDISVKAENAHLLEQPSDVEVVQQVACFDDNGTCLLDAPPLDAHVVANRERVAVDLAQPDVCWRRGALLYVERRADHWRCYIHSASDDARALVHINDDQSVGLEEF